AATGSSLLFSTYLGGNGDDEGRGAVFDTSGNLYVAGRTDSTNFPTTSGAYSTDPSAGGFVTKFNLTGTIVFSTYFRTPFGPVDLRGIGVDGSGNGYITGGFVVSGTTTGIDAFVTKLNSQGSGIAYTQTIRGSKDETGKAITVDGAGNIYVAGETTSLNFPA